METELDLLKARIDKLEKKLADSYSTAATHQPELNDIRIYAIINDVGNLLRDKAWNSTDKRQSIQASFEICTHFNNNWPDKSDHNDLQFLVSNVGKNLGIDYMPSYTAIQDWIKAFEVVQLSDVYLIGKSAAIILAKKKASQLLVDYVICAAENNDVFSIEKVKDLITRERENG